MLIRRQYPPEKIQFKALHPSVHSSLISNKSLGGSTRNKRVPRHCFHLYLQVSTTRPPKMVLQTLSEDQEETTTPGSAPVVAPTAADLDAEKIAAVKAALDKAREKVKASFADTKLGIGEKEQLFPQFHKDELKIGNVLGKGGFGTVSEILGIRIKKIPSTIPFRSGAGPTLPRSRRHHHRWRHLHDD